MNIKSIISDDDAVSPVIGVILMVAITVILAAVIATFVLGLGDQVSNTAPQASFSFDYEQNGGDSDELMIVHEGGDSIDGTNLNATTSGAAADDGTSVSVGYDVFTTQMSAGSSDSLTNATFKYGSGAQVSGKTG